MLELKPGRVAAVLGRREDCVECLVQVDGELSPALAYPSLTGEVLAGDAVWVNVAAMVRRLGTGGYHFIAWGARPPKPGAQRGHILKLNYTPWQMPVLAVEEENSPFHAEMAAAEDLAGMPVVAVELHSQVAPAVAGAAALLRERVKPPAGGVVFVMTDGGALPLAFSRLVSSLREFRLLSGTITCGHAYGGDLEAVNVFSGLLAARHVMGASVAVVGLGPGQIGTKTPFGFSGTQQGVALNAVTALGGRAVACLRLDFADPRPRHRGLSHHSSICLGRIVLDPVWVAVPHLPPARAASLQTQIDAVPGLKRHHLQEVDGTPGLKLLKDLDVPLATMGRGPQLSPEFFLAASAAGALAARLSAPGEVTASASTGAPGGGQVGPAVVE